MSSSKAAVCSFRQCIPMVSASHDHEVLQALYQQQQTGSLCDVSIIIENEKVPAHKAVLAASSKYFSALFETGQENDAAGSKAGNVREIVLSSVPRITFLPILHFMYTSQLHIFKENVNDILNTARKLQIASIVEICTKISEDHVILPSLGDERTGNQMDAMSNSSKNNDILYVDLGQHTPFFPGSTITHSSIQPSDRQLQVQAYSVSNSSSRAPSPSMVLSPNMSPSPMVVKSTLSPLTRSGPCVFSCSQCSKSFKKKANLKRHILIKHSSVHKYICPKCGKRYAIEQSLQYHMSTSKCSKRFSLPSLHTQTSASHVESSKSDCNFPIMMTSVSSSVANIPDYLAHDTVIDSEIGTLTDPSILQQALVSVNQGDTLSLVMPPTTLFPSLAHIQEDAMSSSFSHLDALNSISTDRTKSPAPEQEETFICTNSNLTSDDGANIPTIKSVQNAKDVSTSSGPQLALNNASALTGINLVSVSSFGGADRHCAPDTTTSSEDLENSRNDGTPKLIKIAPKTPLMMPLKRQHKHKLSAVREKVPVVVRSPINISSLSSCMDLHSNADMPISCDVTTSSPSQPQVKSSDRICRDRTQFDGVGRCTVCGRLFHSMDALIYHKRKCCKCPFCNRIFSQYSNMKRHVGIFHTKLKPHECSICGRAYGIKQSLRFHMEAKHGIPYVTRKYNRNASKSGSTPQS